MKDTFDRIWSAGASLLGVAVFLIVIWAIARSHSHMWRRVSARYQMRKEWPAVARKLETIVVTQRGALKPLDGDASYRQYAGTIVTVTEAGLRLSLLPIPPLNVMAPALFLPFDEMALERTSWALWQEPFALRMRNLPDVDIILARDAVEWVRLRTGKSPFSWRV